MRPAMEKCLGALVKIYEQEPADRLVRGGWLELVGSQYDGVVWEHPTETYPPADLDEVAVGGRFRARQRAGKPVRYKLSVPALRDLARGGYVDVMTAVITPWCSREGSEKHPDPRDPGGRGWPSTPEADALGREKRRREGRTGSLVWVRIAPRGDAWLQGEES